MSPAIRDIVENGVPADADVIYAGRNCIVRVVIDGIPVVIKAFRRPGFLNAFVYTTLRKSKAYRSYHNSMKLISLGFNAPEPIAFAERRDGVLLRESYYFSTEVKGDDLRYWERRADAAELTDALAAELVRLTRAGVCHLDLSPGNVIFTRDSEGRYSFSFIDLNRMDFGVTDRDKLLTSVFERINELEPVLDLAAAFARHSGEDEKPIVDFARKARLDFVKWMNFKKNLKPWKKK